MAELRSERASVMMGTPNWWDDLPPGMWQKIDSVATRGCASLSRD